MTFTTGRTSKKDRQGRNGVQAGGQADGQKGRQSWHAMQAEQARKTGRAEMAGRCKQEQPVCKMNVSEWTVIFRGPTVG